MSKIRISSIHNFFCRKFAVPVKELQKIFLSSLLFRRF